jgi:HAD superfamily phosphatase (TIGR01668 family)
LFSLLCPKTCSASVLDIEPRNLRLQGIEALILDVDNTIVEWRGEKVSNSMKRWVSAALAEDLKVCIVSNGISKQVAAISKDLSVPAIAKAGKPTKRSFLKALKIMDATPQKTAVIGDQVFTDILGGNRLGMHTILINPVGKQELKTTKVMRRLEKWTLTKMYKKGLISLRSYQTRFSNE